MAQGGSRLNSGRKSLADEQKTFKEIHKFLPQAMEFLEKAFSGDDTKLKKWATEQVFKKTIPDLQAMELTGKDGEDLNIVINVVEQKKIQDTSSL